MYRSSSGSLVFGAGTVQWSWGLDPYRDTETGVPPERANPTNIRVGRDQMGVERDIQQATLNLFMDMEVEVIQRDIPPGMRTRHGPRFGDEVCALCSQKDGAGMESQKIPQYFSDTLMQ